MCGLISKPKESTPQELTDQAGPQEKPPAQPSTVAPTESVDSKTQPLTEKNTANPQLKEEIESVMAERVNKDA